MPKEERDIIKAVLGHNLPVIAHTCMKLKTSSYDLHWQRCDMHNICTPYSFGTILNEEEEE